MAAASKYTFVTPTVTHDMSVNRPPVRAKSRPKQTKQQVEVIPRLAYTSTGAAASTSTMTLIAPKTTEADFYENPYFPNGGIERPGPNDILCGRGVSTAKHAGNMKFKELVGRNKELYVSSTKKGKMTISRSIVDIIRTKWEPAGRFLEMDKLSRRWFEVPDKRGIEKTAQALRDEAAELRKQLTSDLDIVAMDDSEEEEEARPSDVNDDVVSSGVLTEEFYYPSSATVIPPNPVPSNTVKASVPKGPKQAPKKKKAASVKHTRRVSGDQTVPQISSPTWAKCKTEPNALDSSMYTSPVEVSSPSGSVYSSSAEATTFAANYRPDFPCDEKFPNDFFTPNDDLSEEDGEILGELFADAYCDSESDAASAAALDVTSSSVAYGHTLEAREFTSNTDMTHLAGSSAPVSAVFSHQAHTMSHDPSYKVKSCPANVPTGTAAKQIVLVISEEQLKGGSLIYIPPQNEQTQDVPSSSAPLILNQVQQVPPNATMYTSQTIGGLCPMDNVQTINHSTTQVQIVQMNGQAQFTNITNSLCT